jgi:hypothetical protein
MRRSAERPRELDGRPPSRQIWPRPAAPDVALMGRHEGPQWPRPTSPSVQRDPCDGPKRHPTPRSPSLAAPREQPSTFAISGPVNPSQATGKRFPVVVGEPFECLVGHVVAGDRGLSNA